MLLAVGKDLHRAKARRFGKGGKEGDGHAGFPVYADKRIYGLTQMRQSA